MIVKKPKSKKLKGQKLIIIKQHDLLSFSKPVVEFLVQAAIYFNIVKIPSGNNVHFL